MKYFYSILGSVVLLCNVQAQECNNLLSLFNESAKVKIYEDALPRYEKLIEKCPDVSLALYVRADKMFEDLAEASEDPAEAKAFIKRKIENQKLRLKHMPDKSPIGSIYSDIAETMYKNNIGTTNEQFDYFEEAWTADSDNFKSPKGIYTYFLLYNELEEKGEKQLNDLFAKFDELTNHIEKMKDEQAAVSSSCLEKTNMGEKLTMKESKTCDNSEVYLRNYELIIKGMNKIIGDKANCENIIPLYTKGFEANKEDKKWLKIATARMNAKECTSDPLFIKLVDALNTLEPSSKTLMYLGRLASENKDYNKAIQYYKEGLELSDDNQEKARINFYLAESYREKKAYSTAYNFYTTALKLKPSFGIANLRIADMIAKSANDCGETTFEKRGVYWIAEKYAKRAAAVDAGIKSNALKTAESYRLRAPSTSDVFQSDLAGKTITYSCWFNDSVEVPTIGKN